jgi:hypothetical protein
MSKIAYSSYLLLITHRYYLQSPLEESYGMKRCVGSPPPRIALRCLVSGGPSCGLVNMSTTIWQVVGTSA